MQFQVESNGTVLSTNWKDVGQKKVEGTPPDGMELKKWEVWCKSICLSDSLLCTLLCTFHCWLWVCKVLFLCKLLLNVDMGLLLDFYLSHLLLNFRWVLTGIFLLRKSCFVLNDCIMVVCDFFSRLGRSYSRFKVVSCCIFLWNCSFGSSIDN